MITGTSGVKFETKTVVGARLFTRSRLIRFVAMRMNTISILIRISAIKCKTISVVEVVKPVEITWRTRLVVELACNQHLIEQKSLIKDAKIAVNCFIVLEIGFEIFI